MITHGELFAGISGFGLGFSQSGIETLWHVEIDAKCQSVLERHYPGTLILSDVRDCGAHNLPPVDIISFGSPCQDLSVAGRRKGLIDGEKSSLFFEAVRIVDELKPIIAVWENVPGAFSSNSGRDFAAVLGAFRDIGARDIAWTVLDAQYFGVAQRRRRVFLVADFRGERAAEILFESSRSAWNSAPSREKRKRVADPVTTSPYGDNEGQHRKLIACNGVSHALTGCKTASGRLDPNGQDFVVSFPGMAQGSAGWAPPSMPVEKDMTGTMDATRAHCVAITLRANAGAAVSDRASGINIVHAKFGVRRLTPTECCRLQGFPDTWNDNQSDTQRYRQLGNAVAVPCAKWIGSRIVKAI